MTGPDVQTSWLQSFQDWLHYSLPPLENTALLNVGSLAAVAVGLFLVFRSAKFERAVVAWLGLLVGAWLGWRVSLLAGTPGPISMAVGGVALAIVAYRTHRWWLAGGSVAVLFVLAVIFQVGRGLPQWQIPRSGEGGERRVGEVRIVSPAEQMRNLHPHPTDQLVKVKDLFLSELKQLGPVGWLVPLAAALVGGLLAVWALRLFAVVWLGFVGASAAVLGGSAFLCAHWPQLRSSLIAEPRGPAGVAIGLWLLGLIFQAKEARFPRRTSVEAPPKGASAKTA